MPALPDPTSIPTRTSSSKRCGCSQPVTIGSRCWRCYVRDLAIWHKLTKYRWWSEHFNTIEAALFARYCLALMDEPLSTTEEFIKTVWPREPMPWWARDKKAGMPPSKLRFIKVVHAIQNRARKDQNEVDHRSQESGG